MTSMPERSGVIRDEKTGELILPATQRPDGTWRKPRRVKDGYIPQDEVPVFETKGNQFAKNKPDHPIGLSPKDVEKMRTTKQQVAEGGDAPAAISKNAKKNAKRKEKRKQQKDSTEVTSSISSTTEALSKVTVSVGKTQSKGDNVAAPNKEDLVKKVKNLRKKLKQIEELEIKIKNGDIKKPEKEQLEKISRKQQVLEEIEDMELDLED